MGIAQRIGRGCRIGAAGLLLASIVYGVGAPAYAAPAIVAPLAIETLPGDACNANALAANDDDSTGPVALPFPVNFFGTHYTSVFVNNNGSITFNGPLATFTPFDLATDVGTPIIAPFFADADTRAPLGGGVHYGATADHRTFCVNWSVGYFNGRYDKSNSFQLLLVDRSTGPGGHPGDFDIVMNYDHVRWETGSASGGSNGLGGLSARVGYSNGTGVGGSFFELDGSGVAGSFLDGSATALNHGNRNSPGQNGRYVFPVRNGAVPVGGSVAGHVYAPGQAAGLFGAFVQVCPEGATGDCYTNATTTDGGYQIGGLPDGDYYLRALPPAGSTLLPVSEGRLYIVGASDFSGVDLTLTTPRPLPAGTTITNRYISPTGVPVLWAQDPLTLTTHGCPGGTAMFSIESIGPIAYGPMDGSNGTYTVGPGALSDNSGDARVETDISCPDGTGTSSTFDVDIEPSSLVLDQANHPVVGATVTLLRSEHEGGPYVAVPDGSGILTPTNRHNPDATDGRGLFGWDELAGFYRVRVAKAGCVSPTDPAQSFVLSPVLTAPVPGVGIVTHLDCSGGNRKPTALGQKLSTPGAPVALTVRASDPDGDPLTYTLVVPPAHGTITGTAPAWTYTPDPCYVGPDVLTFKASDRRVDSNAATVGITVTPAPTGCPTAPPVLDTAVARDQLTRADRITAPKLTTFGPNELLVAFVEADGPATATQTVLKVTGGGLQWTLAARSNSTGGTTEVWQAYAPTKLTGATVNAILTQAGDASLTVAAFRGAAKRIGATATGGGTAGGPTASIHARSNGLIWAAGHDSDQFATPVLPAGQSLVHLFLDTTAHDTFWTQKVDAVVGADGPVTVSDGHLAGRWTLALVEIQGD